MISKSLIRKLYSKAEQMFPPIKILKRIYAKFRYPVEPKRYQYLFDIIRKNKCKKIMEIGTYDGKRALQMIKSAQKHYNSEEIEYYGFDLFDMMNGKIFEKEVSKKPPSLEEVRNKLKNTGSKIYLFRGFTKDTIPRAESSLPKMNLVFIDGGHSIETIKNDWYYTQKLMGKHTVVIFDDYWSGDWANRKDAGCRDLIKNIDETKFDVKILPIQDKFKKNWGVLKINFVKVQRRVSVM